MGAGAGRRAEEVEVDRGSPLLTAPVFCEKACGNFSSSETGDADYLCPTGIVMSSHCGGGPCLPSVFPFPQPPSLSGLTDQVALASGIEIMHWPSEDFSPALDNFQQQKLTLRFLIVPHPGGDYSEGNTLYNIHFEQYSFPPIKYVSLTFLGGKNICGGWTSLCM